MGRSHIAFIWHSENIVAAITVQLLELLLIIMDLSASSSESDISGDEGSFLMPLHLAWVPMRTRMSQKVAVQNHNEPGISPWLQFPWLHL